MTSAVRLLVGATLLAGLFASLVLTIHRESPRTLVSAHGLLHAGVATRFEEGRPAQFPPEDPFFAGERLPYYWFFQWVGARTAAALHLDLLHAFELMIVTSLGATVLLGAWLGRRLFGGVAPGLLLGFLVIGGCHPQGPLLLLLRLWKDGADVLFAADGSYLWGLVHPLNAALRVEDPFCMTGPLLPFFLNVTARPLGLAALLAAVLALELAERRRTPATFLAVALAFAACGAFSSVVVLGVAAGLTMVMVAMACLSRSRGTPAGPRPTFPLAAMWLGVALAAFTFHHLFGAAGFQFKPLGPMVRALMATGASVWLLLVLAGVGAASVRPERRRFCVLLLLTACGLLGMAVIAALPVANQDNWMHAAVVLLAVPAAGFVMPEARVPAWLRPQGRRVALVLVAFLPTLCLVAWSYTGRPAVPLVAEGGRIQRTPAAAPEARLYDWIRTSTNVDAVFVVDPEEPALRSAGNTLELPALTGRTLFTEQARHYLAEPFAEAGRRVALAQALARGEADPAEETALLEPLGRDVYVVTAQAEADDVRQRLEGRFDGAAFRAGELAVFRWRRP